MNKWPYNNNNNNNNNNFKQILHNAKLYHFTSIRQKEDSHEVYCCETFIRKLFYVLLTVKPGMAVGK